METQPNAVHARLVELLRAEGADFRLTHHDAVTTSAEAAVVRGAELRSGAKAMLVKGKGGFVLAVLAADRKVDWKLLAPLVGGKGARFANDGELREATGLTKGAVPPFGRLFGVRTPGRTPTRLRCRERTWSASAAARSRRSRPRK